MQSKEGNYDVPSILTPLGITKEGWRGAAAIFQRQTESQVSKAKINSGEKLNRSRAYGWLGLEPFEWIITKKCDLQIIRWIRVEQQATKFFSPSNRKAIFQPASPLWKKFPSRFSPMKNTWREWRGRRVVDRGLQWEHNDVLKGLSPSQSAVFGSVKQKVRRAHFIIFHRNKKESAREKCLLWQIMTFADSNSYLLGSHSDTDVWWVVKTKKLS